MCETLQNDSLWSLHLNYIGEIPLTKNLKYTFKISLTLCKK